MYNFSKCRGMSWWPTVMGTIGRREEMSREKQVCAQLHMIDRLVNTAISILVTLFFPNP
jgi:hypothetical protein